VAKAAEEAGKKLGINTEKYEEGGFVVFAKFDKRINARLNKISAMKKTLPRNAQVIIESTKNLKMLDEFENSLTSYLNQVKAGERVPLATDFYLPSAKLGQFLEDLKVLERSLKLDLALYGSYSAECYSLRPRFDVEDVKFLKNAVAFIRATNFIINREGGSISGGAAEGRVKALVSNMNLSEDEKNLYTAIKDIFDPQGIMNPGVKLGADPRFTLTHFRTTGSGKTVL
jgi:FAD/FMN-containing dehydrogenase